MPRFVAAEAGIPVGYMTMASAAFTGPATLAGTLVVGNAEVITALALMQIALSRLPRLLRGGPDRDRPPHRRLHRRRPGGLPLRRGDERAGRFLPRPALDGRLRHGRQGARLAGRRRERALGVPRLGRPARTCSSGLGLLNGSRIWSHEQLLLDAEIYSIVRATLRGIPVDDESLALDDDRRGRAGRRLPHRAAHAAPHARAVAAALHGPAPDGHRRGRGRRAARLGEREGARAPRDPRARAAGAGARRRACPHRRTRVEREAGVEPAPTVVDGRCSPGPRR